MARVIAGTPESMRVAQVLLDGKPVAHVTLADEEKGYLVRSVVDDRGHVTVNPANRDEILVETLRGDVKIIFAT